VPVGNPLILAQLADKDDHTEDSLENDSKLEDSDNFLDLLEQIRQVRGTLLHMMSLLPMYYSYY
jgi:hypothetical protein